MRRITRFTDNLGDEDRRSYRRWTRALLLSYVAAIAIAFGATYFGKPSGDQQAANETQVARLKSVSSSTANASSRGSTRP